MPKAVFVLTDTIYKWKPPFGKDVSTKEVEAEEGQLFDELQKEGSVFRLLKCDGSRALVEFSEKFTLKGHEHPRNRQIWVGMLEATDFTYLWGNDGITKSLKLKEIMQ